MPIVSVWRTQHSVVLMADGGEWACGAECRMQKPWRPADRPAVEVKENEPLAVWRSPDAIRLMNPDY